MKLIIHCEDENELNSKQKLEINTRGRIEISTGDGELWIAITPQESEKPFLIELYKEEMK